MRHRRGLMVEASLVLDADATAAAMHATLAARGYTLNPLARGHIFRRGRAHLTLVWRQRRADSSTVLNVTLDIGGLG